MYNVRGKKNMDRDKWKELIDSLREGRDGYWCGHKEPLDFDAILRIYEEESRKIRY
jgi:hypothetical protein